MIQRWVIIGYGQLVEIVTMPPLQKQPRYTHYHFVVFILTFISYAFFHATRKTFSNVKSTISQEWSPSFHNKTVTEIKPDQIWNRRHMFNEAADAEPFLGALDAAFMISYAVGIYISGFVGDRLNMRYVLSFGMCSSAVMVFMFGCTVEWLHYYNIYLYMFIWIMNGLLQSTGWPTVVAIMANWFGQSSRGLVLGIWSACASVGNIIGAFMVASVLDYGYDYAFLFTASVLFAGGIINFFGLVTTPHEVGLLTPEEWSVQEECAEEREALLKPHRVTSEGDGVEVTGDVRPKAIGFCTALLLPGVILYALSYAFLKLVNYSFFFWLPFYLHNSFNWLETTADEISVWYDVGGIIGGTIAGFISDRLQKRAIVVIPLLVLAIPALFGFAHSPSTLLVNSILLAVTGFFTGGVSNLVSATIAADLGQKGPIRGNSEALATVTGIIDGTGSVGAAIGQILVPVIQQTLGWQAVFILFMVALFLTALCILPMFVREVISMWEKKHQRKHTALFVDVGKTEPDINYDPYSG